jgi:hypothetical protein
MDLTVLWFGIIAFLFVGYFVLDGFDFGVGMTMPFVSKDDTDRRVVRSGTSTRPGSLSPVHRCSRRSPSGTRPCSAVSTCHCS